MCSKMNFPKKKRLYVAAIFREMYAFKVVQLTDDLVVYVYQNKQHTSSKTCHKSVKFYSFLTYVLELIFCRRKKLLWNDIQKRNIRWRPTKRIYQLTRCPNFTRAFWTESWQTIPLTTFSGRSET